MKSILVFLLISISVVSQAQTQPDSVTISRFAINNELYAANWKDSLTSGGFVKYIRDEKVVWRSTAKDQPPQLPFSALLTRIEQNGYADIAKCFIPRHSINYYQNGKIVRYLLVCFECDGLRSSTVDEKKSRVKSADTREKQMKELRVVFNDLL